VNILIAPDKFKDALDAAAAAAAMAAGVRAARPDAECVLCPLGDGGEGTGRLLAGALGYVEHRATVLDPLGREREARWWSNALCTDAIVEMAEASGLWLLKPQERDPTRTTSYGTGQLLRHALDAGCQRILLCVGGSATVDGGAGCLQALGWSLIDERGDLILTPATGGMLRQIAEVRPPPGMPPAAIQILCDVQNPLCDAAPKFGPQKGATPQQVEQLFGALSLWGQKVWLGPHPKWSDLQVACGGAAGGLPFGLHAALGTQLLSGFDEVARVLELPARIRACDIVLTGEGRLDEQTAGGKVVAGVARLAKMAGKPAIAFVGAVRPVAGQSLRGLSRQLGLREIVVITPADSDLPTSLRETAANLTRAVAEWLKEAS